MINSHGPCPCIDFGIEGWQVTQVSISDVGELQDSHGWLWWELQ